MSEINDIINPVEIKNIKELAAAFNVLVQKLGELRNETEKEAKSQNEYAKSVNKAIDVNNKLAMTAKELESQNKQLVTTNIKLTQVNSTRNKELQKQKIALADANKEIRDQIKLEQAAAGSLGGAKLAWSAFGKSVMAGTGIVKSFNLAVKATGAAIASVPIIGWIALAVTGLGLMASKLVKNAQEFGKASASLKAITGASAEDMDFMKAKAKEFARESTYSAAEVLKAFEKVGSAAPQLLKNADALTEVTKASITLSESSGGLLNLEDSAKAVTAAMNQFNIPATESNRIINTLAAGSQAGSAEVQDLTASFKNVGAVASGAGMSLEETVAALETLGEKGLYAEEAGTKLRGSIIRLQKAGLGYASGTFDLKDALTELNGKMAQQGSEVEKDRLALKIFGSENITAGRILTDNVQKFTDLTAAVTGTNTAYEMAEIQTNNLTASKEKFGNAWSSLMLSIEDGGGILSKIWKGFLDGMTAAFNGISKFIDKFKSKEALERKAAKIAEKEREEEQKATEEQAKETEKVEAEKSKKQLAEIEKRKREQEKYQESLINQQKKTRDESQKIDDEIKKNKQKALEDEKDLDALFREEEEKSIKDMNKLAEESANILIAQAEREYNKKVLLIRATSKTKEEADERIFQLEKETSLNTIAQLERSLEATALTEEEKLKIKVELEKAKQDLDTLTTEKEIENAEKVAEKKKEINKAIQESAIQVAGAVFDFTASMYDNELAALEEKNKKGELSEKEYAKQRAEIELKQAKLKKVSASFDIIVDTASAIMSALKAGPPMGPILAVAAGITGGLQLASVLSAPLPTIPAFAKGTESTPSEFIAGERGAELGIMKTGQSLLIDKPTYFKGNQFAGMKIISNPELQSMTQRGEFNYNSDNTAVISKLDSLEKTIANKPVFIFDEVTKDKVGYRQNNHTVYNVADRYISRLKRI